MRRSHMILALEHVFKEQLVVGAEIGVFRGEHSLFILQTLNIERLYLIDSYVSDDPNYNFKGHMKASDPSKIKEEAREQLAGYTDKVVWIYSRSDIALGEVPEKLDFVYIDANHRRDYVRRDIENCMQLVKSGGFIGGHDYVVRSSPFIEVKLAVDDFIRKHQFELHIEGRNLPDWWFQVP